jgi:LPXTG-site transpeptidase (sortase) family protein
MTRFLRIIGLLVCVVGLGLVLLLQANRFYSLPEVYPAQVAAENIAPANPGIMQASAQELNGAATNLESMIKSDGDLEHMPIVMEFKGASIRREPIIEKTLSQPDALSFPLSQPEPSPTVESTAPLSSTQLNGQIQTTPQQETRNAITRLVIPALKLDAEVKYVQITGNTWDLDDLGQSVAWLGSIQSNDSGRNLVLAGHVTELDGGHGPFRYLSRLKPGAQLTVYSERHLYTYRVRELSLVEPEDAYILEDTENPRLTLLTCATWNKNTKSYLHRQVVIADLIETELIFRENSPPFKYR